MPYIHIIKVLKIHKLTFTTLITSIKEKLRISDCQTYEHWQIKNWIININYKSERKLYISTSKITKNILKICYQCEWKCRNIYCRVAVPISKYEIWMGSDWVYYDVVKRKNDAFSDSLFYNGKLGIQILTVQFFPSRWEISNLKTTKNTPLPSNF